MKEYYKIKLERHAGCEGCSNPCQFNGPVAHPDKAKETKSKPFNYNSKKAVKYEQ